MEASFGDIHMNYLRTVHLRWKSKPLEWTPSEGSVVFSWKDQGWGEQRGLLYLMLMSAAGEQKATHTLTDHVSPHEWERISVELAETDPVLAEATIGDWYQIRAECTIRGDHELYVNDMVFSLTGECWLTVRSLDR